MKTLDDILKSDAPQTRAECRPIPGMDGGLQVFELSLAERILFLDDSIGIGEAESPEEADKAFADKWLWRLLSGPDREPKEGEAEALQKNLSHDQTQTILALGYDYGVEEAEKK